MDGDGAGGYSVGTLDKPTTRLSQYARGKTGSMNPFTPGGEVNQVEYDTTTLLCRWVHSCVALLHSVRGSGYKADAFERRPVLMSWCLCWS